MNFSVRCISAVTCVSALIGLSACGGGGGGEAAAVVPPPAIASNTQAAAILIVKLGLLTVENLTTTAVVEQAFFANFLKAYVNSSTGGSVIAGVPASCVTGGSGKGTLNSTVTKAASYPGLRAGDSVSLNFTNCALGASTLTLNGTAVITVQAIDSATAAYPLPDAFRLQYQVSTTNFEFITATQKTRSNGVQIVDYNAIAAGPSFAELNITPGQTPYSAASFSSPTSASPVVIFSLKPAGGLYSKLSPGNAFVSGVSGDVDVTSVSGLVPLTLLTNTRLAGSIAAGRAIPIAGDLSTRENNLSLQTRTAVQGLNATVQADLNRDGVFDTTNTVSVLSLTN